MGRNSWPPGFRFHPTDEELILYYLKRKINRKALKLDIIAEIDVYKVEPEELPGLSLLKNGDRLWFFFSPRDRKYPNGIRSNRSTKHGYWKATGKDRIITCNSRNVGVKKTLVFYRGRAPSGERTDWVMHEYTLDEDEYRRCQNAQDYYAIYKLFKKSGPGPKNGEQYGAPFREEEWVDDDECNELNNLCNHANHVQEVKNDVSATDGSREYQRHLSADDIDEVLNSIIAEPPPHRDDERLEITNISNHANHVQEVKDNAVASRDQQRHLSLDDIDEVMNSIIAEPPPQALDVFDFEQALSEFVGEEETQSTLDHVSSGEAIYPESTAYSLGIQQDGLEGNFNVSPTALGLQMWDVPQVASSTNINGLAQGVADEDFLEMDDLLVSDPVQVPGEAIMPQYIGDNNLPENSSQQLEQDGLNEFDLFYDADFNVDDLLQAQPSNSYSEPHEGEVVDQASSSGAELYPNSVNDAFGNEMWSYANSYMPTTSSLNQQHLPVPTRGVVYGGNSTTLPTEPNQNQSGEEGAAQPWFSSTLWSFVESIPAAPASAAEATLVNKAFVRMSSFSRLRINAKTVNAAANSVSVPPSDTGAAGGTMRGLFIFSFLVMVFAVACVFLGANVGVFGKAVRRINL